MVTALGSSQTALEAWHHLVEHHKHLDAEAALDALLAPEAVFRSPAVHAPQEGKAVTASYLRAAMVVLGPTLVYHRRWSDESSAVLEFTATIDGLTVHGVDMITWNTDQQIVEFTVMVRPHKALNAVIGAMAKQLFG